MIILTTCSPQRASKLETWPDVLHAALRTANASSGLTTRGEEQVFDFLLFYFTCRVSKCWLKTSDQGKGPSTKGSVSGQKACGAPGDSEFTTECNLLVGALPEEPESLPTSGEMSK